MATSHLHGTYQKAPGIFASGIADNGGYSTTINHLKYVLQNVGPDGPDGPDGSDYWGHGGITVKTWTHNGEIIANNKTFMTSSEFQTFMTSKGIQV